MTPPGTNAPSAGSSERVEVPAEGCDSRHLPRDDVETRAQCGSQFAISDVRKKAFPLLGFSMQESILLRIAQLHGIPDLASSQC